MRTTVIAHSFSYENLIKMITVVCYLCSFVSKVRIEQIQAFKAKSTSLTSMAFKNQDLVLTQNKIGGILRRSISNKIS